jgi:FkbM family methyltransferase
MSPRQVIKRLINRLGYELKRLPPCATEPESIQERCFKTLLHLRELSKEANTEEEDWRFLEYCERNLRESRAQLLQDLFVLFTLQQKRDGFFVEFGATDGKSISNTYTLEKHYGWTGILAEPARGWHEQLRRNRGCKLDFRCVWDRTGERLAFKEVLGEPELSTIADYADRDHHRSTRSATGIDYQVETVSVNDLLAQHQAPKSIDYLSIDTEGSELQIIQSLDFNLYNIKIIPIEHNHTENRDSILSFLESKGYIRLFNNFTFWDDWYVLKNL